MADDADGISARVRQMKFMQRPKEEELKKKMLAEQRRRMHESHWVLREESTSVITLEESVLFDRFTPGRRSFKGFNPQLEALNAERRAEDAVAIAEAKAKAAAKRQREDEDDVPPKLKPKRKQKQL